MRFAHSRPGQPRRQASAVSSPRTLGLTETQRAWNHYFSAFKHLRLNCTTPEFAVAASGLSNCFILNFMKLVGLVASIQAIPSLIIYSLQQTTLPLLLTRSRLPSWHLASHF